MLSQKMTKSPQVSMVGQKNQAECLCQRETGFLSWLLVVVVDRVVSWSSSRRSQMLVPPDNFPYIQNFAHTYANNLHKFHYAWLLFSSCVVLSNWEIFHTDFCNNRHTRNRFFFFPQPTFISPYAEIELVRHIQPQHQFNMYKRYKCCTRIKVTKLQIDTKPTGKTLGDTNENLRLQAREKKKVQELELYKTTTQKSWQVSEYTP